jgi:hypothetical protein
MTNQYSTGASNVLLIPGRPHTKEPSSQGVIDCVLDRICDVTL